MLGLVAGLALAIAQAGLSQQDVHRLVEQSAQAIIAQPGSIRGEALGRFDTAVGEVRAFRTDFTQGVFHRRYVFLVEPKEAGRGPMSIMLSDDANAEAIARSRGERPPLFLDFYACNMHATLGLLAEEPSFEELRARVVSHMERVAATPAPQGGVGPACGFGGYVLPGLDRGR